MAGTHAKHVWRNGAIIKLNCDYRQTFMVCLFFINLRIKDGVMDILKLPDYTSLISINTATNQVFDPIRQKQVKLTPEEWVRQNIIQHLLALGYPKGLIAAEQPITFNGLKKRCDIVVYNRQAQPSLIVECKAPHVGITQKVFDQIAVYNLKLNVEYLIVTNGLQHFCCKVNLQKGKVEFLYDFPEVTLVVG